MKCPFCDNEMETGYIQCRDGVVWSKKLRAIAALSIFTDSLVLARPNGGPFAGASIAAYNCPNCKKIIVDYNEN